MESKSLTQIILTPESDILVLPQLKSGFDWFESKILVLLDRLEVLNLALLQPWPCELFQQQSFWPTVSVLDDPQMKGLLQLLSLHNLQTIQSATTASIMPLVHCSFNSTNQSQLGGPIKFWTTLIFYSIPTVSVVVLCSGKLKFQYFYSGLYTITSALDCTVIHSRIQQFCFHICARLQWSPFLPCVNPAYSFS